MFFVDDFDESRKRLQECLAGWKFLLVLDDIEDGFVARQGWVGRGAAWSQLGWTPVGWMVVRRERIG